MAEFNEAVLTQKGINLLAKAQAEQATIQITKAVSGAGEYEPGEDLVSRTALEDKRQEFAPTSIRRQNESNVFVNFTITNYDATTQTGLTQGYRVTEVGLMAMDPDEGEILYAIATASKADYLQPYNGLLPATMGVSFLIVVDNAESVTITTDHSAYATNEDLNQKGDALAYDTESGRLSLKANGDEISCVTITESSEWVSEEEVQAMIDGTYVPGQHGSSGGGSSGGSASDDDIASDEDIADILNGLYG